MTVYPNSPNRTFSVLFIVLPKFEVKLETPSYILSTEASFVAKVSAQYTYGEPVVGTVTLRYTDQYGYTFYNLPGQYEVSET